jgi:hypothetical protein
MRLAIIFAAFILAALAVAQEPTLRVGAKTFSIGPARMIAGEVSEALWSPAGADMAYVVPVDSGAQIGLFNLKRNTGKVVLTLSPTEHLEQMVWLNSGHKVLLLTRRNVEGRPAATDLLTIKVADAEQMESQELWSAEYPVTESATIDLNPSPTLAHALVMVRTAHSKICLVVTDGAKSIVESQDLADVAKAGREINGWSTFGTAIFTADKSSAVRANDSDSDAQAVQQLLIAAYTALDMARLQIGDPVYECVPSNGVLRPVRFPGYYELPERPAQPVRICMQSVEAHLGQSSVPIQSLWLVLRESGKEPSQGLLVSAEVEGGWLSPSGHDIAFTSHHALFIRHVVAKN